MNSDSRIVNAHSDSRAASAAIDDARTSLAELLDEGPELTPEDHGDVIVAARGLQIALTGLRLAQPALQRIADRFAAVVA